MLHKISFILFIDVNLHCSYEIHRCDVLDGEKLMPKLNKLSMHSIFSIEKSVCFFLITFHKVIMHLMTLSGYYISYGNLILRKTEIKQ